LGRLRPPISGFYWTTDVALMDEIRQNVAEAVISELSGE
jgi:hypothetical protein